MFMTNPFKTRLPIAAEALKGRDAPLGGLQPHTIFGTPLQGPFPATAKRLVVGLGCFWGAERLFWQCEGVVMTAVGYSGGLTPNPTYEEVCSGQTGHTEVVLVIYEPDQISLEQLLARFWEAHDPTQGMRQGNDRGTQYRSALYISDEADLERARLTAKSYGTSLAKAGYGEITTEIMREPQFYYAEDYHQQYLDKNPNGYCGLAGCQVPADFSPPGGEDSA